VKPRCGGVVASGWRLRWPRSCRCSLPPRRCRASACGRYRKTVSPDRMLPTISGGLSETHPAVTTSTTGTVNGLVLASRDPTGPSTCTIHEVSEASRSNPNDRVGNSLHALPVRPRPSGNGAQFLESLPSASFPDAEMLIMVRPNDTAPYEYLVRSLARVCGVTVILERRRGDRRREQSQVADERRNLERRIRQGQPFCAGLHRHPIQTESAAGKENGSRRLVTPAMAAALSESTSTGHHRVCGDPLAGHSRSPH
jgi:hypothetical protein